MNCKFKILGINEFYINAGPILFICHGLGPCIGVFIWDSSSNLVLGAHLALPKMILKYQYHSTLNYLIDLFVLFGPNKKDLKAKIAGGSTIFNGKSSIGELNCSLVIQTLNMREVRVLARDLGGNKCRRVLYSSESHSMEIIYQDLNKIVI